MNLDELVRGRRKPPRPPSTLRRGGAGRRLWRGILSEWELRPDEAALLALASRSLDEIELMRKTLALTPALMIRGGRGSVISHPLLDDIRKHEVVVAKLLERIGIEEAESHGDTASRAGAALVNTRWARRRGG